MVRRFTLLMLLSAALFASCGESQRATGRATSNADDPQTFLLNAAATDFKQNVAPAGVTFRGVHAGVLSGDNGATIRLICGEFLRSGEAEWQRFATLQTEGYENWLGAAAIAHCERSALETGNDLAGQLTDRYRASE